MAASIWPIAEGKQNIPETKRNPYFLLELKRST